MLASASNCKSASVSMGARENAFFLLLRGGDRRLFEGDGDSHDFSHDPHRARIATTRLKTLATGYWR